MREVQYSFHNRNHIPTLTFPPGANGFFTVSLSPFSVCSCIFSLYESLFPSTCLPWTIFFSSISLTPSACWIAPSASFEDASSVRPLSKPPRAWCRAADIIGTSPRTISTTSIGASQTPYLEKLCALRVEGAGTLPEPSTSCLKNSTRIADAIATKRLVDHARLYNDFRPESRYA